MYGPSYTTVPSLRSLAGTCVSGLFPLDKLGRMVDCRRRFKRRPGHTAARRVDGERTLGR